MHIRQLRGWLVRLFGLLHRTRREREFAEELESHLAIHIEDNLRAGMSPKEARRLALIKLGGVTLTQERCREQGGLPMLETLLQDLRFGLRMLRKNPGFSLIAILTLALGIGANTAIFSVVNGVLLKPLPFPESDRLVRLSEAGLDWSGGAISYPNISDWREQQTVFEQIGFFRVWSYNLTGKGDALQLLACQVSPDVFAVLRVQPVLGRVFTLDEDQPGGPRVVVLSHTLWQSRFGGDLGIVNQTVTLNGDAFTVLGVMPTGFKFPGEASLWVPVQTALVDSERQGRAQRSLSAIGRLKSGITFQQARAELDTIGKRLAQQYPNVNKNRHIGMEFLLDSEVGNVKRALWILLGAVALVLLIACANVANLLLARAAGRQREMAVRAALGAGRWRIARQLLSESVLLAGAGGAAGLFFAYGGLRLIVMLGQNSLPRAAEIGLDPRVLLFSALVALSTGILFGLVPAWHASQPDLQGTLKEGARGTTGGRTGLRHVLIVAEVAVALVLLVGAGLLLRSFYHLLQVNPGFTYERVLTFQITLPKQNYPTADAREGFFRTLLERLRALPGVEAASVASQVPLDMGGWHTPFLIEGWPELPLSELPLMEMHVVSPDYFRVMGIPVLRGRAFTEQDNREHTRGTARGQSGDVLASVAIIDEEFARRHFPNEDPIGRQVRIPWGPREKNPLMTVVGVVGRVREDGLKEHGGKVQVYLSSLQMSIGGGMGVQMKTASAPETLITAAWQQVRALDSELPIYNVRTLAALRADNIAPDRLNLAVLGIFAALALALAMVGLGGVLAYAVAQRQREIGVRMALGAQRGDVLRLVIGEGMKLVLIGALLGLGGALALTRLLKTLLFGVSETDPLTFIVIAALLIIVALLACWIPARRATNVDPLIALRHD